MHFCKVSIKLYDFSFSFRQTKYCITFFRNFIKFIAFISSVKIQLDLLSFFHYFLNCSLSIILHLRFTPFVSLQDFFLINSSLFAFYCKVWWMMKFTIGYCNATVIEYSWKTVLFQLTGSRHVVKSHLCLSWD